MAKNATCTSTSECVKGNYCATFVTNSTVNGTTTNTTSLRCDAQVTVGGACKSSWDCVNPAGCLDKVCTRYYYLF